MVAVEVGGPGLVTLPVLGAGALSTIAAGRVMTRSGRYEVFPVIGLAAMSAGLLLFSTLAATGSRPTAALFMVVFGTGFWMVTQILMVAIHNAVSPREAASRLRPRTCSARLAVLPGWRSTARCSPAGLRQWLPVEYHGRAPARSQPAASRAPRAASTPSRPRSSRASLPRSATRCTDVLRMAAPIALARVVIVLIWRERPLRRREHANQVTEPSQPRLRRAGGPPPENNLAMRIRSHSHRPPGRSARINRRYAVDGARPASRARSVSMGRAAHTLVMSDQGDAAFFRALESHRGRMLMELMRRLPSDPRCAVCRAPYGGVGGRIVGRLGFAPSRKNPRLCSMCFERAPMGGVEMEVGILFADVRGFTSLAEREKLDAIAALMNRFYAAAVAVVCEHAIIDKLVGDQVMALYLPRVFAGVPALHMLADARALLAAVGYATGHPWVEVGIGLDFGTAYVGNVGAGEVKDFTAIGDVVNTAARLQAAAGSGEIVISKRVNALAGDQAVRAADRDLTLKGKSGPETAFVERVGGPPSVMDRKRAPHPRGAG